MIDSTFQQLPNHRHRNLKAFEEHIQDMALIVLLQSSVYRVVLSQGLGWSGSAYKEQWFVCEQLFADGSRTHVCRV